MEVFSQYFRRLLQSNASHIFPSSARSADTPGTYQLLVMELQKITTDVGQASKIANALDTNDGDLFKDFDLVAFTRHFKLDSIATTILAVACKDVIRPDLQSKGLRCSGPRTDYSADLIIAERTLSDTFDDFLANLSDCQDADAFNSLNPAVLAAFVDGLVHNPPHDWSEERRAGLHYAIQFRYGRVSRAIPYSLGAVMYLIDLMTAQNPLIQCIVRRSASTLPLDACKTTLSRAETSAFTPSNVANALLYATITSVSNTFDATTIVSAIRQLPAGQRLDWQQVIRTFDCADLYVTKSHFLSLYNALLPIAQASDDIDIQALWGATGSSDCIWANPQTQLSFVVAFLSATPDELDVSQIPHLRRAFSDADFVDTADDIHEYANRASAHPMVSLDATKALFTIIFGSQEAYNMAQKLGIPEAVINANTDVFVCAASAVEKPWEPLQEQALKQLFSPFMEKALPNYGFVMHSLWVHDKMWLAGRLIENYNMNQMNLTTIFEHARQHDWIEALIGVRNDFGLDFTAMAHSMGLVKLDQWAADHIENSTVPASELSGAIINFLRFKIEDELAVQNENASATTTRLRVSSVFAFLNVIQGTVTEQDEGAIQRQCISAYPRLINYGYKFDEVIDANGANGNALSWEADTKMQEEYKHMYGGDADARKMINTLRALKDSEIPADQELFASMIGGLFDEYNCFGEYPLEALATTAVLFGGIINFGILHSRITLSVALYMVVKAVAEHSPEDSMYKFGLQALIHFTNRLEEWPQLCERLCRMPGLRGTEVLTQAEQIVRNTHAKGEVGLESGVDGIVPGEDEAAFQPFTSVNVDEPSEGYYEQPDESTSDKVMFALNNVSVTNLDVKFKDLQSALQEKHHRWFAQYLVGDLVKSQPNFQSLYLQVLDRFDVKSINTEVLQTTYQSIQAIINSEHTLGSSTDRGNLKNLAGWLGLITLARNVPILHRNISFKDLLIEAHQTQRLLIAIPFTCKVLALAAQSIAFRPPNPWTMELVGLLIELYHFAELKLNLKFEIEVLCKELDLDHKTIEPLEIIRAIPMTPDETGVQQYQSEAVDGFSDMLGLSKRANERISAAEIMETLPDLGNVLVLPPPPGNVNQQTLKLVFLTAARQAIQEIIGPVVDRSVTIAAISTSQLVEKDFATDGDLEKMQHSAYTVVKALSGSLALVTCKEPLRMAMSNNIRLLANEQMQDSLPEGTILMFLNDNLDTVCKMVEDTAESYSLAEIDAHLEQAMEARRVHAQQRPNQPFNDRPVNRYALMIPEPYRLDRQGLNDQQLAIYEDFGRQAQARVIANHGVNQENVPRQLPDVLTENYLPFPSYGDAPGVQRLQQQTRMQTPPSMQLQQAQRQMNGYADSVNPTERITQLLGELLRVAREAPEAHIRDLGPSAPTREVYEQLVHLVDISTQKDSLAVMAGQQATALVYNEAKTRLEIEVLVQFLNQLCAISVPTARQLIMYLADMEEERLFNATVTVCLLRTLLLDMHHVDAQVTKALQQRRLDAVQFLATLFEELLLSEQASALRADFVLTLGELGTWASEEPDNAQIKQVLRRLEANSDEIIPSVDAEAAKHDQMQYVFEEWIQLQRPDVPDKALVAFVSQLHASGLVTKDKDFALFLRICLDLAVKSYERQEALPFGNIDHAYINTDAIAKMISLLVVCHSTAEGDNDITKTKYLENLLCFVVLVVNHHHRTRGERFNSKVFYRLFSSLMLELNRSADHFEDEQNGLPSVIGQALLALQPQLFSGFSFAWVSLVGHRIFVAMAMRATDKKVRRAQLPPENHANFSQGWSIYVKLLCTLLAYLGELAQTSVQATIVQDYYCATLRILCLLQHDFPAFVAENYMLLNSSAPTTMVQLHNVINCANPSPTRELPDPFTSGLKVNRLEQTRQIPVYTDDLDRPLQMVNIKDNVDTACADKKGAALDDAIETIAHGMSESVATLDVALPINARKMYLANVLTLYIANHAMSKTPEFKSGNPTSALFRKLLEQASPGLRYQIMFAMVNQIRHPNAHTLYFSNLFLHLFAVGSEDVQQTLIRVLVERLMVAQPHPWGLIVTILELVKNKTYNIFEQKWMKAAPEVEKMLMSISQTQELRSSPVH